MKYLVSIGECTIMFDTGDEPYVKFIELYLRGVAKLLNRVRGNNDWVRFGRLMQMVVRRLRL